MKLRFIYFMAFLFLVGSPASWAQPPFRGTIFIEPKIITEEDPTTFVHLKHMGSGARRMFDRRLAAGWATHKAHLFLAEFDDGSKIEVQVNPEFSVAEAETQAAKYLPVVGRLPKLLRRDVETIWIHQGLNPFGGGNNNLLIHTEQGEEYLRKGILEETLCHEAAHTSLDAQYAKEAGWLAAQAEDKEFISTYARENPAREDIAESFLLYLAIRHKSDRISQELKDKILQTIPNRIKYLDSCSFEWHPLAKEGSAKK